LPDAATYPTVVAGTGTAGLQWRRRPATSARPRPVLPASLLTPQAASISSTLKNRGPQGLEMAFITTVREAFPPRGFRWVWTDNWPGHQCPFETTHRGLAVDYAGQTSTSRYRQQPFRKVSKASSPLCRKMRTQGRQRRSAARQTSAQLYHPTTAFAWIPLVTLYMQIPSTIGFRLVSTEPAVGAANGSSPQ